MKTMAFSPIIPPPSIIWKVIKTLAHLHCRPFSHIILSNNCLLSMKKIGHERSEHVKKKISIVAISATLNLT